MISVIVKIHNKQDYLHRCIQSIINQSYTDLEIMCIDDASTDQSKQIIEQYMLHDPRIHLLLNSSNKGIPYCEQMCINNCHGQWIGHVDADDWIDNDYFAQMTTHLNHDIIQCSSLDTNMTGGYWTSLYPLKNMVITNHNTVQLTTLVHACHNFWLKLYKRELFNNFHIPDINAKMVDIYVNTLCLMYAQSIYTIDNTAKYHYTIHHDSISKSSDPILHHNSYMLLKYGEQFCPPQWLSIYQDKCNRYIKIAHEHRHGHRRKHGHGHERKSKV